MLNPRFSFSKKSIFAEVFGERGVVYFWEERFLPRWLPILLGIGLGLGLAYLIAKEAWLFATGSVFIVPVTILFNAYPFVSILLWSLLEQFFVSATGSQRIAYWILHRAMIPATLILVIVLNWMGARRKRKPVRLGWAELSMLIFVGVTLTNIALLSEEPRANIEFYDVLFVPFCAYWLIRIIAPDEKDLKRFLWVAFIGVVAQSIIGLLSWFAPGLLLPQWQDNSQGARTVGTLQDVAVYTSALILFSVLLFHQAMNCKSRWLRSLLMCTFSLASFCVFFSFSRASWMGGSLVVIGLILMYRKVMIPLVIALVVIVSVLGSSVLAGQIAWGYERLTGEHSERTADNRLVDNYTSFKMIEAKPFFGWGHHNRPFYRRLFTQTRIGDTTGDANVKSHHTYLKFMVELGLVGFFFYIFPVVWWLWLSIKHGRKLPNVGFWNWRLLVALWLSLMHMFIVSSFIDMGDFHFGITLQWIALGLIANMVYPYTRPNDEIEHQIEHVSLESV